MSRLSFDISQGLYQRYQDFWIKYYFKFVLPKVTTTTLEGITLDLTGLSLKVRNRILNVGYEDQERKMCREFLKKDDSVLEVGGAIGFIGLFCHKALGIRDYLTIEANPKTVEILRKNYALNGLVPNVMNVALAEKAGEIELNTEGDFWENSVVTTSTSSQTVKVPAAPLDTLLGFAKKPANVLIMDIEGAEQYINWTKLPRQIEKVIIELHPGVIGQEKTYQIVSDLVGSGFKVAREEENTFAFLKGKKN